MELPYDPAIPLLSICAKKSDTLTRKNVCMPVFIAAIFTLVKMWKQPKCPSADEWIKKLQYLYTSEYNSAIKKNEILTICNNMDEPRGHVAE